jgi:NAD(P)-dependent dehydrogenase (short-subunit alcohol dehydrogenase family)
VASKAALITGGTSGIGLAIARMLQEEGYDLTIASRRQEKVDAAATELGGDVVALAANVREESEIERVVAAHRERWGRLDLLVNSAGIGIARPTEELDTKYWDIQFDVNVRAIFLFTKLCLPMLREAKGWVVNLASIAGVISTPGNIGYGASKAAVISFTKTLNAEFESDGIRAIAICPALVDTPMTDWAREAVAQEDMIRPEDCAEIVRFALRLSPNARVTQVVLERMGDSDRIRI